MLHHLQALSSLLDPTRRRLHEFVSHAPNPVGRDEAATAVGVSRSSAAFHLDKLVESGLLRTEFRRLRGRAGPGAGRPAKVYRRSRRRFDVAIPPRQHDVLARLLAESIAARGDRTHVGAAQTYGRLLGARARRRIPAGASHERVTRCVADVMNELGFEPVPVDDAGLRARNCPFDPLSRRMPSVVCRTSVALVGGVVDGVDAHFLAVNREESPPLCCVIVTRKE